MPDFYICLLKSNLIDIDFSFPCFDVPKTSYFTSGGVQSRHLEQETGNDCDFLSGHSFSQQVRNDREICLL